MRMLRNKFQSHKGMSLAETLAAVLIMSLVTLGIAAGATAGTRVYHQITQKAEAQTLLATNVSALNEYLERGDDITPVSGNEIQTNASSDADPTTGSSEEVVIPKAGFSIGYSEVTHTKVTITNNDKKGLYLQYYDMEDNTSGDPRPLISEKANTQGLYAVLSDISVTDPDKENRGQTANASATDSQQTSTYRITIYRNGHPTNVSEKIKIRSVVQEPSEDSNSSSDSTSGN